MYEGFRFRSFSLQHSRLSDGGCSTRSVSPKGNQAGPNEILVVRQSFLLSSPCTRHTHTQTQETVLRLDNIICMRIYTKLHLDYGCIFSCFADVPFYSQSNSSYHCIPIYCKTTPKGSFYKKWRTVHTT